MDENFPTKEDIEKLLNKTDIRMCEVCERTREIVGVYSSAVIAMSFAFCQDCIDNRAEPMWVFHDFVPKEKGAIADWALDLTFYDHGDRKYVTAESLLKEKFWVDK